MLHNSSSSIRTILIATIALFALSTVLVAQNIPSKEAVPAENEQAQYNKFQTYTGEEYVVYQKDGMSFFFDPTTGKKESKVVVTDLWKMYYAGNLDIRGNNISGLNISWKSPINGNQIIETWDSNHRILTIKSEGRKDFLLKEGVNTFSFKEKTPYFQKQPYGWIDQTHLLIGQNGLSSQMFGIFSLNIETGKEEIIVHAWTFDADGNIATQTNVDIPVLSPSGRYMLYLKPIDYYSFHDGGPTELYLYDFRTGIHKRIDSGTDYPQWLTTKEVSQNPGQPGFSLSPSSCPSPGVCGHPGITFKMPFKCGEVYRVVRDGENCTPTQCGYTDGGYPTANWSQCCGTSHSNKRALDFNDNSDGGSANNNLPVLAAASGTVTWNDFEAGGLGWGIWILHSDGTYTAYGHMASKSSLIVGNSVSQGQTLGTEGCTGDCSGQHIHFARSLSMNGGANSRWMTFDELGTDKLPMDERLYISQNGSCPITACNNITTLSACGGVLTGQSTSGSDTRATYFVPEGTSNNLAKTNMSGSEKIYSLTTTSTKSIKAVVSGNSNLIPIIVKSSGSCGGINTLKDPVGNVTLATGVAKFDNAPAGTYYIIVDGVNGASGNYNLSVFTCPDLSDNGSVRGTNTGRNIPITANIKNIGSMNATPTFKTRFVLSTDTYLGNDYYLTELSYGFTIPPDGTNSYSFTVSAPNNIPSGWYYLIETLDYYNAVTETNESNSWYFAGSFYIPPAFNVGTDDRNSNGIDVSEEIVINESDNVSITTMPTELKQAHPVTNCEIIINGKEITATNVAEGSTYVLVNTLGQICCQGKSRNGAIGCKAENPGIYFISIIDSMGNKCTQKIFIP